MKKLLASAAVILLALPTSVFAHRLDEYLEATILSVEHDHVEGSMRLVPGVAVSAPVIASIDTNGDGVLSEAERQTYAKRVVSDLVLSVDGQPLTLRLVSADSPSIEQMKQGMGEIHLYFAADLPAGNVNRRIVFENHHQSGIAVYLVNTIVPRDRNIQITGQNRNENQSFYELNLVQQHGGTRRTLWPNLSGFAGAFRLGARHISEGTDHLMFLLALLLPAPFIAHGGRWGVRAGGRRSLLRILRIVTAFTVGHSLTLALATLRFVTLPSRLVEVLIAVSILVSAMHAIRPLFPGREAVFAAFFGLIHGLAFATALSNLGFGGWYRIISLLGFNLGIETMQLTVVAAALPSLLILSSTRSYSVLRISGALFAGLAAVGWILERLLNLHSAIDIVVNSVACHALLIAVALFGISLFCWFASAFSTPKGTAQSTLEPPRSISKRVLSFADRAD